MKKLIKFMVTVLEICLCLGFIVNKIEKARGKKGWIEGHRAGFYEREGKRPLDFGLSLFAVIVLWPIMVVTGLVIRIKFGKPVLFSQERPGLGGESFFIKKYRTMRDGEGNDEERLTDFGKKLREVSLDELPELFNIIRGDMSIIGPRPLLVEYLPKYSEQQSHRHDVRPGLTGLAQVSGRNKLPWDKKFEDDIEYVENINFFGDLKILIKTVVTVLRREGINADEKTTMPKFTGSSMNE